jgi:hypothetical protein
MRYIILPLLVLTLSWGTGSAQTTDTTKRTRTIKLTETAGVARSQAPVEVTIRFEQAALKDAGAVRLFRADGGGKAPVAGQVLGVTSHEATDSFAPAAQAFVRLAFLADVPAHGTAAYEVALGGAKSADGAALKVAGDGLGKTLDTGPVLFELHKPSGQLLTITPKAAGGGRLVFQQDPKAGPLPVHWNPDVWLTGGQWGHTSDWNQGVAFEPAKHKAEAPPTGTEKSHPFFHREWRGPLLYRLTRWGRMPFAPQIEVSVTYTAHAGSPVLLVQSVMEFREAAALHTARNAELVFSRGQFDTAVWLTKDGKLHTAPAYDYKETDRSFKEIVRLPPDVPCLGFANEQKGFGVAYVVLGAGGLNKFTGQAADEQAHFYIRDYDEHGQGSPANFLYFVRPVVYRDHYFPTAAGGGSLYPESGAVVVFKLNREPAKKYEELLRWQKALAHPLTTAVD